jgi:hypothetical protein
MDQVTHAAKVSAFHVPRLRARGRGGVVWLRQWPIAQRATPLWPFDPLTKSRLLRGSPGSRQRGAAQEPIRTTGFAQPLPPMVTTSTVFVNCLLMYFYDQPNFNRIRGAVLVSRYCGRYWWPVAEVSGLH